MVFVKGCDTVEAHGAHGFKSREIELHALHFQVKLSWIQESPGVNMNPIQQDHDN